MKFLESCVLYRRDGGVGEGQGANKQKVGKITKS